MDNDQPQRPNKRSKYTPLACVTCKRRKLKCVRDTVSADCQRCIDSGVECISLEKPDQHVYQTASRGSSNEDGRFAAINQKLALLQQRVNAQQSEIRELRARSLLPAAVVLSTTADGTGNTNDGTAVERSDPDPDPLQSKFIGRTRSAFSFDVVRSSMRRMGLSRDNHDNDSSQNTNQAAGTVRVDSISANDPLWKLSKADMIHMIEIFQEELYPPYPYIDTSILLDLVEWLFQNRNSNHDSRDGSGFDEYDIMILKAVLACSMVVDAMGSTEFAITLAESVQKQIFGGAGSTGVVYKELVVMTTLSLYFFHSDQELLAWRFIGFSARMIFEVGLHSKETLLKLFPNPDVRSWVIRLFWCTYILDHRWSFGTSLPFAIQDADIDPDLPEPDSQVEYLRCLVAYGRLSARIWKEFPNFGPTDRAIPRETSIYLDFQIQNWRNSIPQFLQLLHPRDAATAVKKQDRSLQLQRVLLYLRGNHMRILIGRFHVLSADNINADTAAAQQVVDLAKDTIQVLVHLDATSTIYKHQQVAFNYFLISALAVILLAVCHAPGSFNQQCRQSFYNAIEIIRSMSLRSSISRRLWKSIQSLLPAARTLGLDRDASSRNVSNRPSRAMSQDLRNNEVTAPVEAVVPSTSLLDNSSNTTNTQPGTLFAHSFSFENLVPDTSPAGFSSIPDIGQMTTDLEYFYESFAPPGDNGGMMGDLMYNSNNVGHGYLYGDTDEISKLIKGFM